MLNKYPDVITSKELQEILRCKKEKAYRILQNGVIPSIRFGKKYLVAKEDVIKYIRSNKK
ncbi:DNA binding domain protein, excisionase family [Fusobacterium necrophorum subsp. funduliforme ATCC 51357]|uniref:DNA-binding protein n=1 Tax=Fusobacterium necrophorum subsp. funduliforme TaxID=143387 RepID=A0A162IY66_9FUSO|nr:helix-turn-helix domain-containing protein [Fusobacterium necrophorum]EIJ72092.1 DNA binding domain protein, excisionase family [Fusobacterium necrophorum subsp. funduliforme ATCC 51357]KAB0553490.1 helix-turn-helix domain-containing protein [Fusobacterium necrophorum subsp. funduliforme]KYL04687.1 DNA-binding protein [Fusobacterium necrophorum subsp. funduliforme]KYM54817.1 DNA-binding protein [Fusobacterium necrophorum subsp. funduliforme]MCF0161540.1 helix-turn-helix domain-containing pr